MSTEQIIYLHDGTFEGMLNAVAVAVKSEKNVEGVYRDTEYTPSLFTALIRLDTDQNQASRLFQYLLKLHWSATRLAIDGFLSEDGETGTHLYRMVHDSLQIGAGILQSYSHDSVRYLDQLSQRVRLEAHRLNGLIRFRVLKNGLLYAPVEPDFRILGYCADHFKTRLTSRRWILHDINRNEAMYWDTESLQPIDVDQAFVEHVRVHKEVPTDNLHNDETHYQELWQAFHSSIANKDRENKELQRKFMPRRYWKYLIEQP